MHIASQWQGYPYRELLYGHWGKLDQASTDTGAGVPHKLYSDRGFTFTIPFIQPSQSSSWHI